MKCLTCVFNDHCHTLDENFVCVCGQLVDLTKDHVVFTTRRNGFDLEIVPGVGECIFIL